MRIGIADFEIAATILDAPVISTLPPNIRARVNICIYDNTAMREIISGNARIEFRAILVQVFWLLNLCSIAVSWSEFAPPAENNGDPPSRGECAPATIGLSLHTKMLHRRRDFFGRRYNIPIRWEIGQDVCYQTAGETNTSTV